MYQQPKRPYSYFFYKLEFYFDGAFSLWVSLSSALEQECVTDFKPWS